MKIICTARFACSAVASGRRNLAGDEAHLHRAFCVLGVSSRPPQFVFLGGLFFFVFFVVTVPRGSLRVIKIICPARFACSAVASARRNLLSSWETLCFSRL